MGEYPHPNPLVQGIQQVQKHVDDFRDKVRSFYFDVILSTVKCPQCAGQLHMIDQSQCQCECGLIRDPTLEFQFSPCCGVRLCRKTYHYACSSCEKTVASRFVFNERVFDTAYFKEMMRVSRERRQRKREEIRKLLAASRSDRLELMDIPDLDTIPGLVTELDDFIKTHAETQQDLVIDFDDTFDIAKYRNHILTSLSWNPVDFSGIAPLTDNRRMDRAWRFITLIFMQNDQEVEIEQCENDLIIQRLYHEAHC